MATKWHEPITHDTSQIDLETQLVAHIRDLVVFIPLLKQHSGTRGVMEYEPSIWYKKADGVCSGVDMSARRGQEQHSALGTRRALRARHILEYGGRRYGTKRIASQGSAPELFACWLREPAQCIIRV